MNEDMIAQEAEDLAMWMRVVASDDYRNTIQAMADEAFGTCIEAMMRPWKLKTHFPELDESVTPEQAYWYACGVSAMAARVQSMRQQKIDGYELLNQIEAQDRDREGSGEEYVRPGDRAWFEADA